jgi:acyl-coenzyme A thioesterase PaaI-like protein
MAADFEKLIALMPFAGHLGITLVEASGERVVAELPVYRGRTTATVQTSLYNADGKLVSQTTQVQAIRRA